MTLHDFLEATATIPAPVLRRALVQALVAEPARTPGHAGGASPVVCAGDRAPGRGHRWCRLRQRGGRHGGNASCRVRPSTGRGC